MYVIPALTYITIPYYLPTTHLMLCIPTHSNIKYIGSYESPMIYVNPLTQRLDDVDLKFLPLGCRFDTHHQLQDNISKCYHSVLISPIQIPVQGAMLGLTHQGSIYCLPLVS